MHPETPLLTIPGSLHADYFAAGEMNVEGMSSHWKAYAPKSSVRVDPTGNPVDVLGVGFGDMNTRRPGHAIFTSIAAALHAARHPNKAEVPAALAATRQVSRGAQLVFNQDALRQAFTFALLRRHLGSEPLDRIMMIGDGYGLLGAVLAAWRPHAQIVFVDLGRSLLFQSLTCTRVFSGATHALVGRDDDATIERSRFVYWPADRLHGWRSKPIDLAVNIASMQEMSADVLAGYFSLLREAPTRWFYNCNRDRKVMPDGEIAEFLGYPWAAGDQHVVDGLCPWHQWYIAPRRTRGLLPLSLRVPYDGPHLHRLTKLAPAPAKAIR